MAAAWWARSTVGERAQERNTAGEQNIAATAIHCTELAAHLGRCCLTGTEVLARIVAVIGIEVGAEAGTEAEELYIAVEARRSSVRIIQDGTDHHLRWVFLRSCGARPEQCIVEEHCTGGLCNPESCIVGLGCNRVWAQQLEARWECGHRWLGIHFYQQRSSRSSSDRLGQCTSSCHVCCHRRRFLP